jgi:glycopeptide antibiotics resistance protein
LDVDDLILNLYGMLAGYVIFAIAFNRKNRKK